MEHKLDELLKQLHRYLFADSEQVIVELRHYMLDRSLKEADLAFVSSKIFNYNESLLQFLQQSCSQNERILGTVKKRLYELIIDYIKLRKHEASHYLQQIKDTCMVSFVGDPNSLVKEASLQVLIRIVETFKAEEIEETINPVKLIETLLDDIQVKRPSATVKGAIWTLVGLLFKSYDTPAVQAFKPKAQKILFMMLEEHVRQDRPELKAINGMLKGLQYSLDAGCTLDESQLQGLFLILKTVVRPIDEVNNRGVMKAGMKLLSAHTALFTDQMMRYALDLIELALKLCVQENLEVRDTANEFLGAIIKQISESLQPNQDVHVQLFRHIMEQFDDILQSNDYRNIQLLSAIRAVGIFSKAIQTILGDEKLWDYIEKLTELSEQRLIKEFMEQANPQSDLHNFKYILKKQKQLIAYIESYSFIIRNLAREPSERFLQHFMKIGSIGVNNHRKLYNKYRFRFYESLAQLTMSLSNFSNPFSQWIKKFVRLSLTETLKIPDSVLYGGESPLESLNDAVLFWMEYLGQETIWSQHACQAVYDELMQLVISDIERLDLTYKVQKVASDDEHSLNSYFSQPSHQVNAPMMSQDSQDMFLDDGRSDAQNSLDSKQPKKGHTVITYIANNNYDQQYFERLANFLETFLRKSHSDWLLKWVPTFTGILVKKATQTPRISKLYAVLKTILKICSKHKYFNKSGNVDALSSEVQNTYSMLLTFLKELIGKSEEFQDQLLVRTMQLLLHVPIEILYRPGDQGQVDENLHLWKGVMIKALELSHQNNSLAMTCINMLEQWFNALPVQLTAELYSNIVPMLSDFLAIEQRSSQGANLAEEEKVEGHYFFQDIIRDSKDEKVDRRDIANKVLDLLGKIGGHAHSIINNERTKKHDKENFIRWDPEKRLKFSVPLQTDKIEVYLDSCLPRIVDLAQNSTDKETRIAACELLHALILYMIGQSATNLQEGNSVGSVRSSAQKAAFAKLYSKLFPVIIKLASEIEQISRQLFEPLCFQLVRWFSRYRISEHAEVEYLLDALIEGAQSRNNYTLREMCSNAVAEFASWSLRHSQTEAANESRSQANPAADAQQIEVDPTNIRSLVRRIASNSNHPDPFKRLSSVLCFSKIFEVIQQHGSLIDEYCMEITRCVLISLKMCHNSLEFCQEVIDNCAELLSVVKAQIIRSSPVLMQSNTQRSVHASLPEFIDFLFSKCTSVETVYRQECMKLWQGLVTQLPNRTQSQQSIKQWILQRYVPEKKPGSRSKTTNLYWSIPEICFEANPLSQKVSAVQGGPNSQGQEQRKGRILESQKQLDMFAAQLQFVSWLTSTAGFTFDELKRSLKIDISIVSGNIQEFLKQLIKPQFAKLVRDRHSLHKMLICKEDKEALIKSKIRALMQLYQLVNQLSAEELGILDAFRAEREDDVMDTQDANQLGPLQDELFTLAMQVMLVPAAHKLQLLVQEAQLERSLRKQCQEYVKGQAASQPELISESLQALAADLPVTDLSNLVGMSVSKLQPRMLTHLCMGYLKLAEYDAAVKERLTALTSEQLGQVVDEWVKGVQPPEIESTRILIQFMCKLRVKNEELVLWLTEKNSIYQRASDLLLAYIAENWNKEPVYVGEYIISKAGEDMRLLPVFIPILEHVSKKVAGYQTVLLKGIPSCWQAARYRDEYAECQIKIFSLIVDKCKWALENREDSYSMSFINFVSSCIITFLPEEKFQVYLKKSVLHLIGLLLSLKLPGMKQTILQKLSPSLINLKKQYFPVKTRDLEKNSNKAVNFEHIVEGFLDLVEFSQHPEILRMLYSVLREHKPAFFAERLKNTLSNFVRLSVVHVDISCEAFVATFDKFYEEFRDAAYDDSVDDNIRWAIANKILKPALEWCTLDKLEAVMLKYFTQLQATLARQLDPEMTPLQRYLLVREKTHVFLIMETMIRRLDADRIKGGITKSLYGSLCKGNELTTYLIVTASKAKSHEIDGFMSSTRDQIVSEISVLNSPYQVQRRYFCSAYNLLSSVILKTQSKQSLYSSYLFGTKPDSPSIWSLVVDCSSEEIYRFSVQTNFNFVNLQRIEHKIAQYNTRESQVHKVEYRKNKTHNFLNEYVTTSLMSANEKFNSAMVFETQLDEAGMRSERQKVDEIIKKRMSLNPEMGFQQTEAVQEVELDVEAYNETNLAPEERKEGPFEAHSKSEPNTLEMDIVNQHECMKNVKRTLDKMQDLFGNQWKEAGYDDLPEFMQGLLQVVEDPECHLNVKIFILKLLVNNSQLFKPFAQHWFAPVCNFIVQKNTGGVGFHYFLRDLATVLVQWSQHFTPRFDKPQERSLCSKVMNTLIKLAADKSKYIFNINIEIVASLLVQWNQTVYLDKTTLCNMLSVPDSKDGSHLWKMNAIQIIALACAFNVPIANSQGVQSQAEQRFSLLSVAEDHKVDPLFKCLLKMQELRKKQLIFASSEALGKIFTKQPELVTQALPLLLQNEAKDRDDIFVNALERITRDYPSMLAERRIFLKLLSFVNILTGSMRGVVFKSLDRYVQICPTEDLQEIARSLQAVYDEILADISDDNQQNFLTLLASIMRLDRDLARPVLEQVVPRLKPLFIQNKNELSRALFFDIMVTLYDNFPDFADYAKSSLIRGLSDPSKEIREKLITYWSSPQRLSLQSNQRLHQLLTELYDQEEEGVWLSNAVYLLLLSSEQSADFNSPLFAFNLNCSFVPLLINQVNLPQLNRQQPVTDSVALLNQLVFSASQAQFNKAESIRQKKHATNAGLPLGSLPSIQEDVEMVDEQQSDNQAVVNLREPANRSQQAQSQTSNLGATSSQNSGNRLRVVGASAAAQKPAMLNTAAQQEVPGSSQQGVGVGGPLFGLSQPAMPSSLVASNFGHQQNQGAKQYASPPQNDAAGSASVRDTFMNPHAVNQTGSYQRKSGFRLFQAPSNEEGKDMIEPSYGQRGGSQMPYQSQYGHGQIGGKSSQAGGKKSTISTFFKQNEIQYNPIQGSQGQMIRCIPDGSQPAQLARKADKMRKQREELIRRHLKMMNRQHKLIRSYRVGDLPDIQINHKDVLMPLMALVRRDSTIATEVFVELFIQIYNQTRSEELKEPLGKGVQNILASSIKFDYGAISCMHKVAIELLKADQFTVDAEVIARTGKHSMSFQTSLNLLEEMILHGSHAAPAAVTSGAASQGTVQSEQLKATTTFGRIDASTKAFWFSLVEMYEIIGNQDALYGIRSAMGDSECILVSSSQGQSKNMRRRRVQPQSHSSGSQSAAAANGANPGEEDDYTKTVNLIKQVQSLRSRGSITKGLKVLEETLQSVEVQEGFEEQVKLDLQNKRLESLSDLLKWDVISRESLLLHKSKQLYEIPFQQAQIMIRAMLRRDECWTNLNGMLQTWNNDTRSKAYLEQQFNFEQALLQITAKDYDRARFFINKEASDLIAQWQDMTKLSQIAQHMLVNKIQKIYEMKEFLLTCKEVSLQGQDEVIPQVSSQYKNWIQRQPSYSFDKLAVWDDILTARMLYVDCYEMIFRKDVFESHVANLDQATGGKDEIRDIGAILYAQCAKGAYKMGMYDSSDRYLKQCLEVRNRSTDINGTRSNIRIVLPIVKLKTEQFRQDTLNLSQSKKLEQLETIMSVLTNKLNSAQEQGTILAPSISAKANLLQQKLQSKLIKLVISDLAANQAKKTPVQRQQDVQSHAKLKDFILGAFESLNKHYDLDDHHLEESKVQSIASQTLTGSAVLFKAKFGYRFSKLTDGLLRQMEQNERVRDQLGSILRHVGMNADQLASMTVRLTFQSINMGYLKASDAIPRLLDVVSKTGSTAAKEVLKNEFIKESKDTPAWIFLRWISQLIAVVNTSESEMIKHKVVQIAKSYPQALYYPFKVVESNIELNLLSSEESVQTTQLYDDIKKFFEQRYENLNTWTEALNCLVDPEHRARYWLQMIYDCVRERGQDAQTKVNALLDKMMLDVASLTKPYVDKHIGQYNARFVKTVEQYFRKNKLQRYNMSELVAQLQRFDEEIKNSKLKPTFQKLSLFSEYLDLLDNNDFYNPSVYIEIPGQFENAQSQMLSEPIPSKNVKIASVKKELLVLGSIKRPKRITVHGSNEKDYQLLIKGGEDLRLDQRVQQLFSIMNKIFKEDPTCLNREIYLKTFAVTPMTNRLGSLEWVDNTEPLKGLINREHARLEQGRTLNDSRAQTSLMKWLKTLPVNKSEQAQRSLMHQVVNVLNLDNEEVADGYNRTTNLMRWNLLRNGLENLCLTSAAFITIKNQFIKSMATFSIASYLIGVGDRHLENFLVDTTDGEVFGIDFGIAFGSGVQLAMPELMPFRLTQQIEGVIAPHPLEGAYKQTMVHTMSALRKRKSLILDTCEIFVKEPLLDWVKEAKRIQQEQGNVTSTQYGASDYEAALEQLAFYPKKKIDVVKSKLAGVHPSKILAKELRDSKHSQRPYYKRLLYAIQGPKGSSRETLVSAQKQHLEISEQVDCLIEGARDPQILGRAWIGWGAYI